MKYKTLFRVLLKAVGVLLFAQGISQFIQQGCVAIYAVAVQGTGLGSLPWVSGMLLGAALQSVIGLYLFFEGKWVVDKAIPGNRPYCHECGYDLTGLRRNRCPECDTPFHPDEVRPSVMLSETDDPA